MSEPRTELSHWTTLWQALGARGEAEPWHRRLIEAYSEPARHYHTQQHLAECLREFDSVRALAAHPEAVEAALWFHDAVYDPPSATNEADSASLAVECLAAADISPELIVLIRDLILCTKTHEPAHIPDAALLLDIDLAILGQPPARFWNYEAAIRAEYAWVPLATYCEKRAKILARFLQRPAIYRTEPLHAKYAAAARDNLQAAIARLKSPQS
ncbi:MAG: N-methyl-D-aspartate receptor NMDAR2C subunit [Verrucomicrobiota bacterium]